MDRLFLLFLWSLLALCSSWRYWEFGLDAPHVIGWLGSKTPEIDRLAFCDKYDIVSTANPLSIFFHLCTLITQDCEHLVQPKPPASSAYYVHYKYFAFRISVPMPSCIRFSMRLMNETGLTTVSMVFDVEDHPESIARPVCAEYALGDERCIILVNALADKVKEYHTKPRPSRFQRPVCLAALQGRDRRRFIAEFPGLLHMVRLSPVPILDASFDLWVNVPVHMRSTRARPLIMSAILEALLREKAASDEKDTAPSTALITGVGHVDIVATTERVDKLRLGKIENNEFPWSGLEVRPLRPPTPTHTHSLLLTHTHSWR